MAKTHRTTISVPLELKARMDAVEEAVNWSAVACRAFEHKLADILSRKGVSGMKDVVARLRASKQKVEEGRYREGFNGGRAWAERHAQADELERLSGQRDALAPHEWDFEFAADNRSAYGPGENLVFTIRPEFNGDRGEANGFWDQYGGAGHEWEAMMHDGEYVRGFAEGALEVWDEVKGQL